LQEDNIKEKSYVAIDLDKLHRDLVQGKLIRKCGKSRVEYMRTGGGVTKETAEKMSAALNVPLKNLFKEKPRDRQLADSTIYSYYSVISTVLLAAKKSRIIPHAVTEYMDAPRFEHKETKHLDDVEARAFLAALMSEPDIRVKAALGVLLFTGIRKCELCGLEWSDIDFDNSVIHIRRDTNYLKELGVYDGPTKNKSSFRSIAVSPLIMGVLAEYQKWWNDYKLNLGDAWNGDQVKSISVRGSGDKWQGKGEKLLIQADGKPICPSSIRYWLDRFIKQNNLPALTPHGLRHTFITLQIANGTDIKTLQTMSGHARPDVLLNTYAHAIKSAQEKTAAGLENMLLPEPGALS
jgi:integrase